ncbi:MAG: gamma carbonic anhydrase family protein [Bacteroidetes bacterium]|nr:gamma carbonic anhydrase family protein [Bacteroidota bacterium]
MQNLLSFREFEPDVDDTSFVADNARVIGQVTLLEESSVWFGAVLRGDTEPIVVGKGSNIQDNAVIHTDPGFPVVIGRDCIVGHSAIVHGAFLENNVLIGMNATVLNGARIGEYSIIGANALVTSGKEIPPYSVVMGVPGKIVGTVDADGKIRIEENARVYRERAKEYLAG